MSRIAANGIQIEYETFGNPSDRPLLLINGLGGQMIHWDENLCRDLADRGHYVIRYDNRDTGLSTKFDHAGKTRIRETLEKISKGDKSGVPYTIEDMADDGAAFLAGLGISSAHICGTSMGGAIAQTITLRHPSRVSSLISIYSHTGNPALPQPKPEVTAALIARAPSEREAYIEHMTQFFKMIAGRGFPFDEAWTRKKMAASFDRCFYPQGMGRQLVAVRAQNDRRPLLASIKAPVLVVHGTDDPLVSVEGGKDTAAAIPGAELLLIEGMGHDLPHQRAWPQIVEAITAHTQKAKKPV